MKLTKKAKIFLKEVDKVAPLLPKECVLCKHHNPNHLILINEEQDYKIICIRCKNPEKINVGTPKTDTVVLEISLVESIGKTIEKSTVSKKLKSQKVKVTKKGTKKNKKETVPKKWEEDMNHEHTLHSTDNASFNLSKPGSTPSLPLAWNTAYGQPPKGFKGQIWLAESPDPVPIETTVNARGILCEIYYYKLT